MTGSRGVYKYYNNYFTNILKTLLLFMNDETPDERGGTFSRENYVDLVT
jgi:hypothetical protein